MKTEARVQRKVKTKKKTNPNYKKERKTYLTWMESIDWFDQLPCLSSLRIPNIHHCILNFKNDNEEKKANRTFI